MQAGHPPRPQIPALRAKPQLCSCNERDSSLIAVQKPQVLPSDGGTLSK